MILYKNASELFECNALTHIDLYAELPNFDGPNDHEETNVGKNKYNFSRVIGYEELTVKISKKKSGPLGCVASLVSVTMILMQLKKKFKGN